MPISLYFTNTTTSEIIRVFTGLTASVATEIQSACNVTMSNADQCTGPQQGGDLLCQRDTYNFDGIPNGKTYVAQVFKCNTSPMDSTFNCVNTFFNNRCQDNGSSNVNFIVGLVLLSAVGCFGLSFAAHRMYKCYQHYMLNARIHAQGEGQQLMSRVSFHI